MFCHSFLRNNCSRASEREIHQLANWIKDRVSQALKFLPNAYPQDSVALIGITKLYDDEMCDKL